MRSVSYRFPERPFSFSAERTLGNKTSILTLMENPNDFLCFISRVSSSEQADIDRTEIANATTILDAILTEKAYDKNERPDAGGK